MLEYLAGKTDVAIIGAGHAGIEAALAAARLGVDATLFTLSLDVVGNMPCNPSIGGTGKGHLVFEIDALGGEMGRSADKSMIQSRMLNMSKGPAVHSLRMQADRSRYHLVMKTTLEEEKRVSLVQAEVTRIIVEDGAVTGLVTAFGARWEAKAVIIASGTSLNGKIIVGEASYRSGPDNSLAAISLSDSLREAGIELVRFKTGTPPRIHADSIDYSKLELQCGDDEPPLFTTDSSEAKNIKDCYIAHTNERTHKIIRDNLHRSPLFTGVIAGTGPRYCPSIEDKVVRFADKERHQIFVEPMGADTKEVYLQGMSSSLPEEVQKELIHTIEGLENAVFMRTAYAIEYDCCNPLQLKHTLEFKKVSGLYGAGQFNGSSGYEEAAAQGLIAGINAALKIKGEDEFVLLRSESYIGTLIDDLVTKGTNEPYRIMTSRSEYRLLLRQDNAKQRLIKKAYDIGLVTQEAYDEYLNEEKGIEEEIARLKATTAKPSKELNDLLESKGYEKCETGIRYSDLIKRPFITLKDVYTLTPPEKQLTKKQIKRIETEIKYEGYIKRQIAEVERFASLESKLLPADIDYSQIKGIRLEAAQKLNQHRPANIGQASRISGISPADISVLLIYLKLC